MKRPRDSFLKFEEILDKPKRIRTQRWRVMSVSGDEQLGVVYWWSAWRRYVFAAAMQTIYDADCMWDIADFIALRTVERKERGSGIAVDKRRG